MVTVEEVTKFKKSLLDIRVSELQDAELLERIEEVRRVLVDLMGMIKPSMRPMVLSTREELKHVKKSKRRNLQTQISQSEMREDDVREKAMKMFKEEMPSIFEASGASETSEAGEQIASPETESESPNLDTDIPA